MNKKEVILGTEYKEKYKPNAKLNQSSYIVKYWNKI